MGHAVLCAKSFVGNEPFAVLYGDDVIISDTPVTKQLCDAYDKYSKGCVGVKPVPKKDITKSVSYTHLLPKEALPTAVIINPHPPQKLKHIILLA